VAQAATIAPLRTGQSSCFSETGVIIPCAGTGQDGDNQKGVAWPAPRFTDNRDGSVTDNLTGLIWLKNANCTETVGGVARSSGLLNWPAALTWSNHLASGKCGLSDNSVAGDWRLPNINELRSLADYSRHDPNLPMGHPFSDVQSVWYWSSTTNPEAPSSAFNQGISRGSVHSSGKLTGSGGRQRDSGLGVWPVRDGNSGEDPLLP
jgi:hypothetical protein